MELCRLEGSLSAHHMLRGREGFRRLFRNNFECAAVREGDNGGPERDRLSRQTFAS
jgi:hypothetical protein